MWARMRKATLSDAVGDAAWAILAPLLAPVTRRGRPRRHGRRLVLEAVFDVRRGGLAWRLLPGHFPPWRGVDDQFRRWRQAGLWERINAALRERARGRSPGAARSRARRSSTARPPGRARPAASAARTAAKGSAAASGILGSTRRASSGTPVSIRPTRTIGAPPRPCSTASVSAFPRSPAGSPTGPARALAHGSKGSSAGGWRSSNGRAAGCGRRSTSHHPRCRSASRCCPSAGSWRGRSRGSGDSVGRPRTGSGWRPPPRPGSTSP